MQGNGVMSLCYEGGGSRQLGDEYGCPFFPDKELLVLTAILPATLSVCVCVCV